MCHVGSRGSHIKRVSWIGGHLRPILRPLHKGITRGWCGCQSAILTLGIVTSSTHSSSRSRIGRHRNGVTRLRVNLLLFAITRTSTIGSVSFHIICGSWQQARDVAGKTAHTCTIGSVLSVDGWVLTCTPTNTSRSHIRTSISCDITSTNRRSLRHIVHATGCNRWLVDSIGHKLNLITSIGDTHIIYGVCTHIILGVRI